MYVLAALCPAMSQMRDDIRRGVPASTNSQESTHADRNRDGKQLSLLQAINLDERYDIRRFAELEAEEKLGVAGLSGHGEARRATANFRRQEGARQKKIAAKKKPKKTTKKASRLEIPAPTQAPTQAPPPKAPIIDLELEELEKQVAIAERKQMLKRRLEELQDE